MVGPAPSRDAAETGATAGGRVPRDDGRSGPDPTAAASPDDLSAGAREARVRVFAGDGRALGRSLWRVPTEAACAIRIDGAPFATMMATPADLEDFATGFLLASGRIADASAVRAVTLRTDGAAVAVDVATGPGDAARAPDPGGRRALAGTSACGVCGAESAGDALAGLRPVPASAPVPPEAIARAFATLRAHQPLNRATFSVHAAALADRAGAIRLAREDVGRHTALDKLVGAAARAGLLPLAGFVVVSSRIGFELVQKASVAGAPLLAGLSAPTALAIDAARATGMKLATRGPDDTVVLID